MLNKSTIMDAIQKVLTVSELATMGGLARMARLSESQRQALARKGGKATARKLSASQRLANSRRASAARSEKCKVRRQSLQTAQSS